MRNGADQVASSSGTSSAGTRSRTRPSRTPLATWTGYAGVPPFLFGCVSRSPCLNARNHGCVCVQVGCLQLRKRIADQLLMSLEPEDHDQLARRAAGTR